MTKTLLAALIEPGRMLGTREGALRGLISVGREAVKRGLVQASGAKIVSDDMDRAREMGMDTRGVEQALMVCVFLAFLCTNEFYSFLGRKL